MTQRDFEKEITRLMNRAFLLREAHAGRAKLRRIDVKKCVVPEHTRSAHTRMIAPKGWKKRSS
jgi:hypothetical protein